MPSAPPSPSLPSARSGPRRCPSASGSGSRKLSSASTSAKPLGVLATRIAPGGSRCRRSRSPGRDCAGKAAASARQSTPRRVRATLAMARQCTRRGVAVLPRDTIQRRVTAENRSKGPFGRREGLLLLVVAGLACGVLWLASSGAPEEPVVAGPALPENDRPVARPPDVAPQVGLPVSQPSTGPGPMLGASRAEETKDWTSGLIRGHLSLAAELVQELEA